MQSTKIYKIDEIPKRILDTIDHDFKNADPGSNVYYCYLEQTEYIKRQEPNTFLVSAFVGEVYLGGVILFLTKRHNIPTPSMEGIVRSQEGLNLPVKLNSLLIPAIKEFLKERGYSALYVEPLEKQERILTNHYGFLPYDDCDNFVLNF